MADELISACRKRLASGFEVKADLRIPLDQSPVTILFGPSGSGKTTLLRLLAGLDRPDSGSIAFRAGTWHDSARGIHLSPQRRRAAMLFQDYALFPHLTVAANIAYAAPAGKSREFLTTFGLAPLASRKPREISGGQQQKVALARALAAGPALLLLDEPLSALDGPARTQMRYELRRWLLTGGVPAIVVTHDRMEAVAMGDWMAVMIDGAIRQLAPVHEVFRHPADAQVAASVGVENVLPAAITSREGGLLNLQLGAAHLQSVDDGDEFPGPVFACIRAEEIALTRETPQSTSARNRLLCRVRSVVREGPLARVELECGFPLVAVITAQSAAELNLQPGDPVSAILKATSVHVTAWTSGPPTLP